MSIILRRIHPQDAISWALFPAFEARVRKMASDYLSPAHGAAITQEIRRQFVEMPDLTLFLAVLDGDGSVVGHMLAWCGVEHGAPYIHVNQAEVDDGIDLRPEREAVLEMIAGWAHGLNARYVAQGEPYRIETVEFWTPYTARMWERFFRGWHLKSERTVLRFDLPEIAVPDNLGRMESEKVL